MKNTIMIWIDLWPLLDVSHKFEKYNQNLANFKACDWAVKGYKKVGGVLHILKGILTKEIGMPISFHI